jgi:capsular polysaccharide biosynthesis protein
MRIMARLHRTVRRRRKRIIDTLRVVLAAAPIVRRRVSPLLLGRVTSFRAHCEEVQDIPTRIGGKGFYLSIYEETVQQRAAPFSIDGDDLIAFYGQAPSYQVGTLQTFVPPVFLAGLHKASILNNGLTIRSRDNFLFYEPFHDMQHIAQSGRRPLLVPPVSLYLRGEYIHFAALWGTTYYHWVLDMLPRLSVVERFARVRGVPLIVPPDITSTQRQSLQMLGVGPDRLVEFHGDHWQVEHLYFPSLPGVSGNPTSVSARWLRERFSSPTASSRRRLYISRRDAVSRRIVNECELLGELVPHGFEVATLTGMPFADQVQLFSGAEMIVGPHGAGLTNMVFAQPGATVIEVFSPNYINGCYWALANVCGHRYGFMVGAQRGEDIEIDLGKFLRLLRSVVPDFLKG